LFWVTLIGGTLLAAVLLPRLLDSSQQQGYREIDGQGKPSLALAEPITSSVSTRFPVRPFNDGSSTQPPPREAFPGMEASPETRPTAAAGLPQRDVPDRPVQPPRELVTSRVRVVVSASVYESPRTTARVLGTVAPDTQVRWVKTVAPGWEEILLRDGRSVYMQSNSLSVGTAQPVGGGDRPGDPRGKGDTLALLPSTVDSFLETLRQGDLLRASTYLSATAPRLEEPDLGIWADLIGPQANGRMARMEPLSGRGDDWRSVLVIDSASGVQVHTVWGWDRGQDRWLLAGWE
jgi:hypothetical protein